MTATDLRALVALLAPYILLLAVMAFAKLGVPDQLGFLIAGGALAAIDPRRGQTAAGTTVTTGSPPDQTTVETKP